MRRKARRKEGASHFSLALLAPHSRSVKLFTSAYHFSASHNTASCSIGLWSFINSSTLCLRSPDPALIDSRDSSPSSPSKTLFSSDLCSRCVSDPFSSLLSALKSRHLRRHSGRMDTMKPPLHARSSVMQSMDPSHSKRFWRFRARRVPSPKKQALIQPHQMPVFRSPVSTARVPTSTTSSAVLRTPPPQVVLSIPGVLSP